MCFVCFVGRKIVFKRLLRKIMQTFAPIKEKLNPHIAAQKIKSRSHHKATGGHSSGGQLAAMASCTFSNTTR